jgi:hypothetical protein
MVRDYVLGHPEWGEYKREGKQGTGSDGCRTLGEAKEKGVKNKVGKAVDITSSRRNAPLCTSLQPPSVDISEPMALCTVSKRGTLRRRHT